MEVPASRMYECSTEYSTEYLPRIAPTTLDTDWTQTSNGTKFRGMGLQVAATLPVRPLSNAVVPL